MESNNGIKECVINWSVFNTCFCVGYWLQNLQIRFMTCYFCVLSLLVVPQTCFSLFRFCRTRWSCCVTESLYLQWSKKQEVQVPQFFLAIVNVSLGNNTADLLSSLGLISNETTSSCAYYVIMFRVFILRSVKWWNCMCLWVWWWMGSSLPWVCYIRGWGDTVKSQVVLHWWKQSTRVNACLTLMHGGQMLI